MKPLWRIFKFFWPDGGRIGAAFLLLLGSLAANLLKPWPLAWIVDGILGHKPLPAVIGHWTKGWPTVPLLIVLLTLMLALHVIHAVLTGWENYLVIQTGLRGLARVRKRLFRVLERLSMRYLQGTALGDLIYRATWDTYALQTFFQHGVFACLSATLALVFMFLVMWRVDRVLTLTLFSTLPVVLVLMRLLGKRMSEKSLLAHRADSKVATLVQQTLAAVPLIQSYTREPQEASRFNQVADEALKSRTAQHGWELLYLALIAVLFSIGFTLITGVGATRVLNGQLTLGELLIFLAYLAQLYEPLSQLSRVGSTLAEAKAGSQRVLEILDAPDEIREKPNARAATNPRLEKEAGGPGPTLVERARALSWKPQKALAVQGVLEFEELRFHYVPDRAVLDGVTGRIEAGETIALIGPSGAGKTTFLRLIPRFYDPAGGTIQLDGTNVMDLRLADLRRCVAWMGQVPMLLPGTIAENIAFGRGDATAAEIESAARAAQAHAFIERLPHGYQTLVGEGGATLSQGEQQRINLARAFLKNAPILLLDEPTSALDPESEQACLAGLRELARDRTTILVTHSPALLSLAHRAWELRDGRLAETTHAAQTVGRQGPV